MLSPLRLDLGVIRHHRDWGPDERPPTWRPCARVNAHEEIGAPGGIRTRERPAWNAGILAAELPVHEKERGKTKNPGRVMRTWVKSVWMKSENHPPMNTDPCAKRRPPRQPRA